MLRQAQRYVSWYTLALLVADWLACSREASERPTACDHVPMYFTRLVTPEMPSSEQSPPNRDERDQSEIDQAQASAAWSAMLGPSEQGDKNDSNPLDQRGWEMIMRARFAAFAQSGKQMVPKLTVCLLPLQPEGFRSKRHMKLLLDDMRKRGVLRTEPNVVNKSFGFRIGKLPRGNRPGVVVQKASQSAWISTA